MKKLLFILAFVSTLVSCKKSSNYSADCSGPAKSYTTDVAPLLASCSSCHGTQYNGYANVSVRKSSIYTVIADGSMPKGKTLSSTEKNAILCWIDAGAPNN